MRVVEQLAARARVGLPRLAFPGGIGRQVDAEADVAGDVTSVGQLGSQSDRRASHDERRRGDESYKSHLDGLLPDRAQHAALWREQPAQAEDGGHAQDDRGAGG